MTETCLDEHFGKISIFAMLATLGTQRYCVVVFAELAEAGFAAPRAPRVSNPTSDTLEIAIWAALPFLLTNNLILPKFELDLARPSHRF